MLTAYTKVYAAVLSRRARGITFIEYAVLAAIAVFIGFIFRNQLSSLFNTIFGGLNRDATNNLNPS